ncbi:DAK2 domain-containing protein [Streptomyces sp. NPDC050560]|uniref:DAK2 domain-containing protein n=1 Tax=Streptomyces sp. NPDC050560 TaxID=3365630 RepID=UPI003794E53A
MTAGTVRAWCALALDALGRDRERIDAINVFPVADGDTGTNLFLTLESASGAVEAVFDGHEPGRPTLAQASSAMAHGALLGARGNSGTILAQLLRGMAQVFAEEQPLPTPAPPADHAAQRGGTRASSADRGHGADGRRLALALRRAAEAAYAAVAHPVEGTVLTVAVGAADAAARCDAPYAAAVARDAHDGAATALAATPGQLAELSRAGVVDAGGRGLVAVLAALVEALTGARPPQGPAAAVAESVAAAEASNARVPVDAEGCTEVSGGPAFEVIYLLEADDAPVRRLRGRLDELGDSLVIVGGDGLWHVHVHTDDAGAAVEAGIEAGRPHRIRITHFGPPQDVAQGFPAAGERAQRAVIAVVPGEGLAELCAGAGATTVLGRPGELPAGAELVEAIRRAGARDVVLLPNADELRQSAAAAVTQARAEGRRVALIPTRSPVQGIAALAVHEPGRRFDEDVVAMTAAAGSTRHAELTVAERQSWTTVGVCQAGDVLGHIDGDVAVIGADAADTAVTVLDRMLSAGGEMVTLVVSDDLPDAVTRQLEDHVRETHLAVDTVVYRGGCQAALILIGVE